MGRKAGFEQRVFVLTSTGDEDLHALEATDFNTGTEISIDLPNPVNFEGTDNTIDTSDISTRQDKSRQGTHTPGTISFEIFRDTADELAKDALPNGATVILVKFEGVGAIAGANPTDGDVYDAARIQLGTMSDISSGRNESRRLQVTGTVTDEIAWDGVVGGDGTGTGTGEEEGTGSG